MNRWHIASLLSLALTVYLIQSIPEACDDGIFGCDGLRTAPITVIFLGLLVAGLLGFIGFVRSTK
jgi:hypothetical protein